LLALCGLDRLLLDGETDLSTADAWNASAGADVFQADPNLELPSILRSLRKGAFFFVITVLP